MPPKIDTKLDQDACDPPRRSMSIEDMILNEDDPKQRAFLIVLNSINKSLMANTDTVNVIKTSLDDHLKQYDNHMREDRDWKSQGKGAWRVMAWVLGVAQAALIWGGMALASDLKDIHTAVVSLHAIDTKLDARILILEKSQ